MSSVAIHRVHDMEKTDNPCLTECRRCWTRSGKGALIYSSGEDNSRGGSGRLVPRGARSIWGRHDQS